MIMIMQRQEKLVKTIASMKQEPKIQLYLLTCSKCVICGDKLSNETIKCSKTALAAGVKSLELFE